MSLKALADRLGFRSRAGRKHRDDPQLERERKLIRDSGLFDAAFYLRQSPNLAGKKTDPISHYLREGARQRKNPSRAFDTGFYLDSNPDVVAAGVNPLVHFLGVGRAEGRKATADPEDWDARDVPTLTMTSEVSRRRPVYLVPAYLAERNTTRYRAYHLAELLADTAVAVIDFRAPPPGFFAQLQDGGIVILQRLPFNKETETFLLRLRESPALIVYDIDDQVFDPNELEDWRLDGLDVPPAQYARCMALADHFLVSTTRLRDKVERRFRRPAHVITNCLNREIVVASEAAAIGPRHAADDPFIIGYASGSKTHEQDLEVVLPALARFLRANPRAELHCIGHLDVPKSLKQEFGSRIVRRRAVHWRKLPEALAQSSVQIVPLADCTFNRYKSHIRFLEAAAVGVPSVVSPVGELAATVVHQETGFVCGDAESWFEVLQKLHDDPSLRSRVGTAARRHVTTYFTTRSPFLRARAERALGDLELGVCRDKLSIAMVASGPSDTVRATIESIYRTTTVPFEICVWINPGDEAIRAYLRGLSHDNLLVVESSRPVVAAEARNYLSGIIAERFVCGVDAGYEMPDRWDIRMIAAVKAIPDLGWLSTNLTPESSGIRERGPVDSFPGGVSLFRPSVVGDWVMFSTASAFRKIGPYRETPEGTAADYTRRARALGLYAGHVRGVVGRYGEVSSGAARPLHVAIKVCTPVGEDENVWGDTHFAHGLKASLETMGYRVRVDKLEEWYDANSRSTDIVIHLLGIRKYEPDPRHLNLLWIISHPDLIDPDFLYGFDHVFCASDPIADRVRQLAPEVRAETLLQCTDTRVFHPDDRVPRDLGVVFVGNSRKVYREAVRLAVDEGFDVAIWGTLWESFVDRRHIRGQSLTNSEVADVYRRATVVLNDHWDDQRRDGLVNNRIFDVLACNTIVLSDANPGLAALFEGRVPTFADRAGFASALNRLLRDPDRDRLAAELGAETRARHSFDERARMIHAAISQLVRDRATYKDGLLASVRRQRAEAAQTRAKDVTETAI
ncbi:MAG TPA: glycosyltransferase [Bauldia sp.]|nr:glycosyltransferase [Bauldia sp.]